MNQVDEGICVPVSNIVQSHYDCGLRTEDCSLTIKDYRHELTALCTSSRTADDS